VRVAAIGGRLVTGLQYYSSTIVAVSGMAACYAQLAVTLSLRRQEGILKRLRGTPLPAWAMFVGLVAHCIMISLIDAELIVGMGLLYGVPMPGHWAAIIVTLVIGAAAFCALGVAVASLISNAEAAPAVVQFIFFPLVFISGTYFLITSRFLNDLAGVFPVRPFNQALLNPFALDRGFAGRQLLVLAIWGGSGRLCRDQAIPLGPHARVIQGGRLAQDSAPKYAGDAKPGQTARPDAVPVLLTAPQDC
jgi:ABC-2 type transport system permease protein